jgi:MSHA biogenesis protein MshK
MDDLVKRFAASMLALALGSAGAVRAQALEDPTRPPAMLTRTGPGVAAPAAAAGPQLQSVLIARQPGGRQVAVIDGQTVRLGQSYKGAQLVRMSETEVELVRGRERRVLKLSPGATWQPIPALQR